MYATCCTPIDMVLKVQKHFTKFTSKKRIQSRKCHKCAFQTTSKLILFSHYCGKNLRRNEGGKRFKCSECERVVTSKKSLEQHVKFQHRVITNESWLTCSFCDFKTLYDMCLKRHFHRKHKVKKQVRQQWFTCDFCDYQWPDRAVMREHCLRAHPTEEVQVVECDDKAAESHKRLFGRTYGKSRTKQ